jgi:hypothetical protein
MDYTEAVDPSRVALDPKKLWVLFRKRLGSATEVAQLWAALHEACYYYAVPNRNRFYRPKEQQGEFKASRIYDTTAVEATKTFVSKIHDAMTPPQVQWGYLDVDETFNAEEDIDRNTIQEMLDNYMRKLFVYIHESNFDVVINECYFDLAIGTSCLVINGFTDEQPLLFSSVPMDKLAVEEAMTGKVESWYRYWEDVKINEITLRWNNAILSPDMMQMLADNPDAVVQKLYEGVMFMPHRKKQYLYMVGTEECPVLMEEFESNPGIVWRFQKVNSEVFGRGPVMDALPSIISLNELARIELAAANLNTFKPYMGFSDAVFNPHTFKLEPFTVIPIAPIGSGGSPPLIPLPDSSNPQFSQLTIMDLRNQIKTLLFNDVNPNQSIQPETAAAVMIQQQNLAQRIGPLFSRLQQEFLWPVIKRCSFLLDKMGILPRLEIKGVKVNFRYRSPLALMKGQQDIARFTQYYQLMQGVFGPGPALMYINPGLAPYLIAEQMQVDARYLNSPEQVQAAAQNAQNMSDQAMSNSDEQEPAQGA